MTLRSTLTMIAASVLLSACGSDAPAPAPAQNESAGRVEQGGARVYLLGERGLEPDLPFGTPQRQVVEAASAAFGAPSGEQHLAECGEGPMDFVRFGALSLGFQEGRFAGWSVTGPHPSLRTADGLAVRAPRSAIGGAGIDRTSTLGPEFAVGAIGGLLDEREREVTALWAGLACHFR